MARCPDCNRFVSTELSEDLEDSSLTVEEIDKGKGRVTGSLTLVRTCAECGTELQKMDVDIDLTFEIPNNWEDIN